MRTGLALSASRPDRSAGDGASAAVSPAAVTGTGSAASARAWGATPEMDGKSARVR